jgi:hypothetical protein
MQAGGPLSRKGLPVFGYGGAQGADMSASWRAERERGAGGRWDAREATTRLSSRASEGSSAAMSASQTDGTRMHRTAKAATRNATSMMSIVQGVGVRNESPQRRNGER